MKYRQLTLDDCNKFSEDIIKCYSDCHLIFDSQNPVKEGMFKPYFVGSFVDADDALALGIFDDNEKFLYGLVIFDNIRFAQDKSCAEVHIVTDKAIWGRKIRDIYNKIIQGCIFSTLYCQIPTIAVSAIAICKRLGFKKTGYIPEALPYINSKGEEKMYDIQIYTYRREN